MKTSTLNPPKRIAVILSGCGFKDGSEITEAVSTLIALSECGAKASCFAPNQSFGVSRHAEEDATQVLAEQRNALEESARICRGEIHDIADLHEKDFDAVVFPGGFGAALNLSTWGKDGANAKVLPEVDRVIRAFFTNGKPIGAICIAPTLLATVLGKRHVTITIGNDAATAAEIAKTGAQHVNCPVTDYISDRDNKILTTPAYMYEAQPFEVFTGIRSMIRELVEMA